MKEEGQQNNSALDITLINLGGYYLGITESPQQRWVDLGTIQPVLERDFYELMESLAPHETSIIVEENGTQHFMIELFTAYSLLLTSGIEAAKNVAKQLYIHYKVLDRMFYETRMTDILQAAEDAGMVQTRITG